jgi:hypothetical protein
MAVGGRPPRQGRGPAVEALVDRPRECEANARPLRVDFIRAHLFEMVGHTEAALAH